MSILKAPKDRASTRYVLAPEQSIDSRQVNTQNTPKSELEQAFKEDLDTLFAEAQNQGLKQGMADANDLIDAEISDTKAKLESTFANQKEVLETEYQKKIGEVELAHQTLVSALENIEKSQAREMQEMEKNVLQLTLSCIYKVTTNRNFLKNALASAIESELENIRTGMQKRISVSPEVFETLKTLSIFDEQNALLLVNHDIEDHQFVIEYAESKHNIDLHKRITDLGYALIDTWKSRE